MISGFEGGMAPSPLQTQMIRSLRLIEKTKAYICSRSGLSWSTAVSSVGNTHTQGKKTPPHSSPLPPPAEILPAASSAFSPQKSYPFFGWQDQSSVLVYLKVCPLWMVLPLHTQRPPFCFGDHFRTGHHHYLAGSCHFVICCMALWLADSRFFTLSYSHVLRQPYDWLAGLTASSIVLRSRSDKEALCQWTMPFLKFTYCTVIGWQPFLDTITTTFALTALWLTASLL